MVNRDELLHWVQSLGPDSCIGIDEGGLCLREVLPDDTVGEAYYEIGGVPDPRPVTVLQLAEYRLGRKAVTQADFTEAGLDIMGGCYVCGASLAAYNAYPGKGGYWLCADHVGDTGWATVEDADADIFGGEDEGEQGECPKCGTVHPAFCCREED